MKHLSALMICIILLTAGTALAMAPAATPADGIPGGDRPAIPPNPGKALGDPTDLLSSFIAGADYLVAMQADFTEDNAGNGDPDQDLEDGGWDWSTTVFEHSSGASPMNIYGATAQGLYQAYLHDPRANWFTAMKDAADQMVAIGPDPGVRSASDVVFLLNFADLTACPDPAFYRAGAQAIWDRHITVYGSMVALAEGIRDARAGQGYANGIIPWDISGWAEAAMLMHAAFPAGGHDVEGAGIAQVVWDDSLSPTPVHFDVYGRNQGYTVDYSNYDYYWYALGVYGLIHSFAVTGTHTADIPALEATLLACQYADGAFSYQYGAPTEIDDRDWQATAYCAMGVAFDLAPTPATQSVLFGASTWLAATQDVASGGWVYSSGNHYPEIGGEATAAVAVGWAAAGVGLGTGVASDPINCSDTNLVTFSYAPGPATPALRGYDITIAVTGPASFAAGDIVDLGSLGAVGTHAFYAVDNGDGTWTVSDALLGTTVGLQTGADLFTVNLTATAEGAVDIAITEYRLRDIDNVDLFADVAGAGFTIDCTAPPAVTDITAAPGHNKVDVDWAMADESDVDHYEIWRGLWYDTTPGVTAYPEYDDLAGNVIPTRPTNRADALASSEWELAGTATAGTLDLVDVGMVDRGVYWYEVFAVDGAGNFGPTAAANDRATSYWLGDVLAPYNGSVGSGDITQLGATFGLGEGDIGYNNEVDVGPTDDTSGFGIPSTDSVIDFEDLMIFALNYGNVGPGKALPVANAMPVLAWNRVDETTWSLVLAEPCTSLKGVHVSAPLPAGVQLTATRGTLLDQQSGPVFFQSVAGGINLNIAALGTGRALDGSGELVRVVLSAPVELSGLRIDARGVDNSKLGGEGSGAIQPVAVLVVRPNYPNPFNPSTTISFELPTESEVKVDIYSVDGRLVRTLLSGEMPAGPNSVVWDGKNGRNAQMASGTYFYRVTAGTWDVTRKMQLVK